MRKPLFDLYEIGLKYNLIYRENFKENDSVFTGFLYQRTSVYSNSYITRLRPEYYLQDGRLMCEYSIEVTGFARPVPEFENYYHNRNNEIWTPATNPIEQPNNMPPEHETPYEPEELTITIPHAKLLYWLDLIDEGRYPAVLFSLDQVEMFREAYEKRGDTLETLDQSIRREVFGEEKPDAKLKESARAFWEEVDRIQGKNV